MMRFRLLALLCAAVAFAGYGQQPAMADIDPSALAPAQRQILEIMVEASPMPDIYNTPAQTVLDAIDATLAARAEMPWGAKVPEREFRHFVVPLRVNNEPIDEHRPIIYAALKERVAGLNMADAILEVNHFCHEYVSYQPSDGRTHSPLQSMSACIGRCGEESTFTVAALRSVGIPARQVYTPRWAHTDDNHAWVEAWADGKWHFLGACEPEPTLDRAWFNAPATRSMIMHTFVRGDYDGPEEVTAVMPGGVNINVTSTYAPVATTKASVFDEKGQPAAGATVLFTIYNYAEFYPIVEKTADAQGCASVSTGLGDMLVWATDGEKFGFAKARAGSDADVAVTLNLSADRMAGKTFEFDIVPPAQGPAPAALSEQAARENARRLAWEDSVRNARIADFNPSGCADRLRAAGYAQDVDDIMAKARGNSSVLCDYLIQLPAEKRAMAVLLLQSVSDKDLTDITPCVLADHLTTSADTGTFYGRYVLSPRIETEALSPWRAPLARHFEGRSADFRSHPEAWAQWVADSIAVCPDWVPATVTLLPEATLRTRKANARSRDLFFVAGARAMGIPGRRDPVTGAAQWAEASQQWHNAWASTDSGNASEPMGSARLRLAEGVRVADPGYYYHFTISKIEDGRPRLLEYDEDATLHGQFAEPEPLAPGCYMLVTGQRLADGSVLARMDFFDVEADAVADVEVAVRHDDTAIEVIGSFNSENLYMPLSAEGKEQPLQSLLQTTGRGYYALLLLEPGQEPTNHALVDISTVRAELEASGMPIVALVPAEADGPKLLADPLLPAMPSTLSWGKDTGAIRTELCQNLNLEPTALPIIIIADTFNRVVHAQQGYSIGSGQRLLDIGKRL